MSSQYTTHHPADAMPRVVGTSGSPEQPVVLLAFAKLVMMIGALVIITPAWLDLMGQLADGSAPQAWAALRVVAVVGGVGVLALAVMFLRVWAGLLMHLARAD